jgi:hypothetical protein
MPIDRITENHLGAEGGGPIEEKVLGCGLEGEGLSELLDHPSSGRARRDAQPGQAATSVSDHEEDVENAEGGRGDGEDVHGGDAVTMVLEKGLPALDRLGPGAKRTQVPGYAALGDLEAEVN